MTQIDDIIARYQQQYSCTIIELDPWYQQEHALREAWLNNLIKPLRKDAFEPNERLVFVLRNGDEFQTEHAEIGKIIQSLQSSLNEIDISNFFVVVVTDDDSGSANGQDWLLKNVSWDSNPMTFETFPSNRPRRVNNQKHRYQYNSLEPVKVSLDSLSPEHRHLLTENPSFCMYPWIHLHTYPTGDAYPCCQAERQAGPVGNAKEQPLKMIWNGDKMRELRSNMLAGRPDSQCTRCYEQEEAGFFSGRRSANKHHGHKIHLTDETLPDGTLERFEMTYWDIRFSNLCNLSCRSCGHIFSSSWYKDQVKLAGPEWGKKHKPMFFAGRTEIDMWEQLEPHLDYVEQIYFAGGEPLMMDEHYRILEELERRGRFDVRLIYNTNFTQTKLKDRYVFDYWKKFDSVAVGASLDAMGPRGEYIRKGTDWEVVEENRRRMMETCPEVDFYVAATLSIFNAWHLPDFHKSWVEKGLIRAQDLNINILQDPEYYRIDIAPMKYKQRLRIKYEEHLEWLRPLDKLNRATVGFDSAITYMMSTDNSQLVPKFWQKTHQLDGIRKENILQVIPELEALDEDPTR